MLDTGDGHLPDVEQAGQGIDALVRDPATAQAAADAWCAWECGIFGASIHESGFAVQRSRFSTGLCPYRHPLLCPRGVV